MKQWRVGTLSMGILLIALGVIMLASQIMGVPMLEQILKWWPVVLILLGVEILVYLFLSKQEQPRVKFDVLSIFIIAVLMVFGIGAYTATGLLGGRLEFSNIGAFKAYKYESTFKKNITANGAGKDRMTVNNSFGNVQVEKGSGDTIEIEANITIRNNDEAYAKTVADSLIEVTENDGVSIKSKSGLYLNDKGKIGNININYLIKVPEKINVEVENRFGDVSVENILLSAKINNTNGNVKVRSIRGDLTVDNAFGNVDGDDIGGKADVRGRNGNLTVKKVGSSLDIRNSFGDINAEDVGGSVTVSNSNGRIDIRGAGGSLTADGKFSEMGIEDVKGSLSVEDNNGGITLKNIGGDAKVTNRFGNVLLTNASSTVTIKDNNGNITFETEKPVEKGVDIENQFGNIDLKVPKDQQGNFKASTQFGNIDSAFGLNIEEASNRKTLSGTVGDSKVEFLLNNRNGDISIGSN